MHADRSASDATGCCEKYRFISESIINSIPYFDLKAENINENK